jgi:hypothetical protein
VCARPRPHSLALAELRAELANESDAGAGACLLTLVQASALHQLIESVWIQSYCRLKY